MNLNEADLYNLYGRASQANRSVEELESAVEWLTEHVERLEKQMVRLERKLNTRNKK